MAVPTTEEKLKILEEKVNALPEGSRSDLTIKIKAKDPSQPGAISFPRNVCSLGGATLAHVVNPELWLPQLMGGGQFELDVYLPGGGATPVAAGFMFNLQGEARAYLNHDAVDAPDWKGPAKITYPMKPATKPASSATPTIISALPQSAGTNAAPQTSSFGTAPSGGVPSQYLEEMRRMQAEAAAQIQNLQNQIAEERRRAEDERHKRELEAIRMAQQAELASIKAAQQTELIAVRAEMERLKTAASTPPPPPVEKPSLTDMIRDILPAAAPLITAYLSSQAEERRRAEERQARAEERTAELIREMRSKPAIDPTVEKMMERLAAEQQPATALVQQSLQGQATMLTQMAEVMRTVVELSSGPEESPGMKIFREAMGTIKDVAAASAQQAQPKPRRLPRAEGTNGAGANGAPPPSGTPSAQPSQGLHGYTPTDGSPPPPKNALERIREMLLAHEDPDKVAVAALHALQTPEFQKALSDSDMNFERLFSNLMTSEWVQANSAYAIAFGQAFQKQAMMAGMIGGDSEDEDAEEEAA